MSGRVAPLETALQRLTVSIEEERAQVASVAGDYTPQALQVGIIWLASSLFLAYCECCMYQLSSLCYACMLADKHVWTDS